MVVDSSALLAVLLFESEAEDFANAIRVAAAPVISIVNFVEASIVLEVRLGPKGRSELDLFVADSGMEVEPVTLQQGRTARDAYRLYGKGYHPAALNFGDCFAYALAKTINEPLLFKGDDFTQTDIRSAL